jgi:hypothetical protein
MISGTMRCSKMQIVEPGMKGIVTNGNADTIIPVRMMILGDSRVVVILGTTTMSRSKQYGIDWSQVKTFEEYMKILLMLQYTIEFSAEDKDFDEGGKYEGMYKYLDWRG